MEISVTERLALLGILPKEGNFITLKLVRQLREALSFDELELKQIQFRQEGDHVFWNEDKAGAKNVEIGERMTDLIVDLLKNLDEQKKLKEEHFSLYEKFVEIKT